MLDALTIKEWLLIYAVFGFSLIGANIFIAVKLALMVNRLLIESDLAQYLREQRGNRDV